MDTYREKRIAQLKELQSRSKYGSVTPLSRQDFVAEVTVASAACPVILLLYKDAVPDSRILYGLLQRVRWLREGYTLTYATLLRSA